MSSAARRISLAVGLIALVAMVNLGAPVHASGTDTIAGSAGTDTSLPDTTSSVTVHGRGTFSKLAVTVNQTKDLNSQAISVHWTGADLTYSMGQQSFKGDFAGNYLQLMQCWGNDDGTVPDNPGPPPTQCEFGGQALNASTYAVPSSSLSYTRVLARPQWSCGSGAPPGCLSYTDAQALPADRATLSPWGDIYLPFRAVDGTNVPLMVNLLWNQGLPPYSNFNVNPYFDHNDTNELDLERTYNDGTGQDLFQVVTGNESPGLGCGQSVEALADGTTRIPKCWLVVVPRSTGAKENPIGDAATGVVDTSPLAPTAWSNRIAIPLEFKPLDTACNINSASRRIVGGEMAALATASWQPALCAQSAAVAYTYENLDDGRVRQLIASGADPNTGMGVVSQPIDPTTLDPSTQPAYAPLAAGGVVVGFNIQRQPGVGTDGQYIPAELDLIGTRVEHLNLTPRLVAKLLTQSYKGAFASPPQGSAYAWLKDNAGTLYTDPEFLKFNPEFTELATRLAFTDATIVVEERTSDANSLVWQWILDDPEAKAFLNGTPDGSGMQVNPYYSINPNINPAGQNTPTGVPDAFAKSDPFCYTPTGLLVGSPPVQPRDLCALDWWPYVGSMHDAAVATRTANTGSHTTFNGSATDPNTAWAADGPQTVGQELVISLTDAADAARYGLQTAALSRSGDDQDGRTFVAPDPAGLKAGVAAMVPGTVPGVVVPNPATSAPGAYPLTLLSYAVLFPTTLDADASRDYAAFIKFAATTGQTSGTSFGSLPDGYIPLPADMAAVAQKVAADLTAAPTTTTTTTATTAAPATTLPPTTTPAATVPATVVRSRTTVGTPPEMTTSAPPTTTAPPPVSVVLPQARPAASSRPVPATPRSPVGTVRYVAALALLVGLAAAAWAGMPAARRLRSLGRRRFTHK